MKRTNKERRKRSTKGAWGMLLQEPWASSLGLEKMHVPGRKMYTWGEQSMRGSGTQNLYQKKQKETRSPKGTAHRPTPDGTRNPQPAAHQSS